MASISPEDKQRIYQEEKARLEAQEQLKREAAATKKKAAEAQAQKVLVVLVLIAALGWFVWSSMSSDTGQPAPTPAEQSVSFFEAQGKAKEVEEAFNSLSAADHLKEAERLLSGAASRASVATAKKHLSVIVAGSTESKQARALSARADARLRAIDKEDQAAKAEAEINAKPLTVVKSTWEKGGFGAVALWTVTFKNRSKKPVGNIKYRTEYDSETGKVVAKGGVDSPLIPGVIQKVIPPGGTRTVEVNDGLINSEAHRASFEIVGWEFVSDNR